MKIHENKTNKIKRDVSLSKKMVFIGTSGSKSGKTGGPTYLLNTFYIRRKLHNFAEFIDGNYPEDLRRRSDGLLISVGGTTEFEVLTFMRAKSIIS